MISQPNAVHRKDATVISVKRIVVSPPEATDLRADILTETNPLNAADLIRGEIFVKKGKAEAVQGKILHAGIAVTVRKTHLCVNVMTATTASHLKINLCAAVHVLTPVRNDHLFPAMKNLSVTSRQDEVHAVILRAVNPDSEEMTSRLKTDLHDAVHVLTPVMNVVLFPVMKNHLVTNL